MHIHVPSPLQKEGWEVYTKFKRILDLVIAAFLLFLTSWLFILIILVYAISFEFPVFFRQERIGKNEKVFRVLKFRTLKPNGPSTQARRFRWGDFLRFTSLDELPQLVNILRGEMSFIGPRPLPIEYLPLFSAKQRMRHTLRPGVTGWAQVHGRHSIPWSAKFAYDIHYIQNVSFLLDLKILIKTIILVLSFKGDKSLQEEKFTGNTDA